MFDRNVKPKRLTHIYQLIKKCSSNSNCWFSSYQNNHYISFHAHNSPVTCASIAPDVAIKNLSLSNDLIFELTSQYFKEMGQNYSESKETCDNKPNHPVTETGGFSSNLSNVVNNVGTILITTDSQGLIRVFRTDILPEIRKK